MSTTSNISRTKQELENRTEIDRVYIDGDSTGAIFRTIVESESVDELEQFVESELPVSVERQKWVGFGMELTLR